MMPRRCPPAPAMLRSRSCCRLPSSSGVSSIRRLHHEGPTFMTPNGLGIRPRLAWEPWPSSWSSTRYAELGVTGPMVSRALCGGQRRGLHSSSSDGVGDDELDIIPQPDGSFLDRDGPGEEVNHDGRPEPGADPRSAERARGGLRRRTTAEGLPA